MVDPDNITNYNLNDAGLEEVLFFWILAAGKTAKRAARSLEAFLSAWKPYASTRWNKKPSPFQIIRYVSRNCDIAAEFKKHGIGCYNSKSETMKELAFSNLDLKKCSLEDLESVKGIGPKTARCFLIHSRPNQRLAGLDVHILRYIREKGYEVPKSTPNGKQYLKIEKIFLEMADKSGKSISDFDLEIWRSYRA